VSGPATPEAGTGGGTSSAGANSSDASGANAAPSAAGGKSGMGGADGVGGASVDAGIEADDDAMIDGALDSAGDATTQRDGGAARTDGGISTGPAEVHVVGRIDKSDPKALKITTERSMDKGKTFEHDFEVTCTK